MSIFSIIGAILKVIGLFISAKLERNKEIKKRKQEALETVNEGIKERDPSKVTAGFGSLNRL